MPLVLPTRDGLRTQIAAQIAARIPGADTSLARSLLGIVANVVAGALWLQYRAIAWLARQLFVDSAEAPYLDRRLAPYAVTRLGATPAAGTAIFAGTPGIAIPAGAGVQTSDGSVQYATQAAATIGAGGTVSAAILAATPGSAGNAVAGAPLALSVAIAGVQPTATVDSAGLTGGADIESDAALRARGEARLRAPPQGGAASDYLAWAKLTPGVTRAWVYPLNRGAGTVDVALTMDGRASNIPLAADLAAVQAVLNARKPVTADCVAFAPTGDPLAITIHAMVPSDAATRAAVTAQLAALACSVPPGGATIGDGVSAAAPGGTLYLSQIEAAIQAAGTVQSFDLVAPAADVAFATGHLLAVPSVSFT
ncbi:MAG: baseplate J/gp47 family protein [Acetobacteraceae bacterium]|nr:baseplate J/gp47 family protein [Acetobacteraceae bacterium]